MPHAQKLNPASAPTLFRWLRSRNGVSAKALIHECCSAKSPSLRSAAVVAASKSQMTEEIPRIRTFLSDRDPDLVRSSIEALAELKDRESLRTLVDLLESHPEPTVKDAAAVALRSLTGQLFGFDAAAWRTHLASRH